MYLVRLAKVVSLFGFGGRGMEGTLCFSVADRVGPAEKRKAKQAMQCGGSRVARAVNAV